MIIGMDKFAHRFFGHIGTVCTHKRYVRQACFKMGLYRQGLLHDLSKFSPEEFIPSVRYYDGHFSPNVNERRAYGYSKAWIHHKGVNKHHYEHWTDYPSGKVDPDIQGVRMPIRYVAEMIADRYAASRAYNGADYTSADAWNFYVRRRSHILIDRDTRAVLEKALVIMRDQGEDAAFSYMKSLLSTVKGNDYTAEGLGLSYEFLN